MGQVIQLCLGAVDPCRHTVDRQQRKAHTGLVHAIVAEAHAHNAHQHAVQHTAHAVVHAGVRLVDQEHRAEQDRASQQLIPHTLQAGQDI